MEGKYVVCYENNPDYKGTDRFLTVWAGVGKLTPSMDQVSIYATRQGAEDALRKWAYLHQNRPELLSPKVARLYSENKYRIED